MAIDGGMRKQLAAGTHLVANYRKEQHTAEVVAGEEGKLRFRLADGREFTSPSAAGSAVMGGIACNGWRFWSLASDNAETNAAPVKLPPAKARTARKPARAAKARPEPEATDEAEEPSTEPAAEEVTTG